MSLIFEELDYRETPLGAISLRRRTEPKAENTLVYEVKLGEEFLMSSLFVEAEKELSRLALQMLCDNGHDRSLNIVVGGLGLGYTALAALEHESIAALEVVEVMEAVIDWHKQGTLPIGTSVASDQRCTISHADFFAECADPSRYFSFDQPVHAILLDIDHSPSHWLNSKNQDFYNVDALKRTADKLLDGGVFAIWSNEPEDLVFSEHLRSSFSQVSNHLIEFPNPYTGSSSYNSIYLTVKG